MMRTLAAIATLSLVVVAVSALVTNEELSKPLYNWVEMSDASDITDSERFNKEQRIQFFLPLRNEHLLDASAPVRSTAELHALADKHAAGGCLDDASKAAVGSPADVVERLALWRRIVAPSCEHVAAAKQLLEVHGCSQKFDHFDCDALTVGTVKALMNIKSSSLRRVREVNTKGLFADGRISLPIGSSFDRHAKVPTPFAFVSGIQVGAAHQQPRRHLAIREEKRSFIAADDKAAPAPLSRGTFPSDATGADIVAFQPHTITTLDGTNTPPFYVQQYLFTLPCSDDSMAVFNWTQKKAVCENGASFPTSYTVEIVNATSTKRGVINSEKIDFSKMECVAANMTQSGSSTEVRCEYAVTGASVWKHAISGMWAPVLIRVSAQFSGSKSTPANYMKPFFEGKFFSKSTIETIPAQSQQTGLFPDLDKDHLLFQVTPAAAAWPQDYLDFYQIPKASKLAKSLAGCVLEFPGGGGQFGAGFNVTDLYTFMSRAGHPVPVDSFKCIGLSEPNCSSAAPGESQLDIDLLAAISGNTQKNSNIMWNANATNAHFTVDFLDVLDGLTNPAASRALKQLDNLPLVMSVSYGTPEDFDSKVDPVGYNATKRSATKAQLAASAGINVFVSSGDAGSSAQTEPFTYVPSYPAVLPGIVSVGATARRQTDELSGAFPWDVSSALMGDLITSGGGFSRLFNASTYQSAVYAPHYTSTMRATPDISSLGADLVIVINGQNVSVSGTSASSPLSASLVLRVVNDLLLAGHNASALADFYKSIYDKSLSSTSIVDVDSTTTTGSARGFANNINCYPKSFTATSGWDPASGVGQLMYPSFKSWAMTHAAAASGSGKGKGLGGGAIAGIVIGAVAFVVIIGVLYWRKKASSQGDGFSEGGVQGQAGQQSYGAVENV